MGAAEDTQQLMNALMNFAQARLKEAGGFAPFSGSLDAHGVETLDSSYALNTELPARAITEQLTAALRALVIRGGVRAAALAADVHFGKKGSGEWRDAVELHIEHESGYCVDIFVPYRVRKGWRKEAGWRVRFSHPVGQEGVRRLFTHDQAGKLCQRNEGPKART